MHELALQHQITGNVHSDSFWMGSYVLQVIAVFLQTGSFTLYASTPDPSTTGFSPAFKDHFLHLQRVFPSFSSDPIVREASGNPAFGLRPDQAVEATLDNLLIRGVETRDVAFCFQELLVDGMMDLCEEWLILLRHVVALEHDTTLKFATVDMHKQYMLKLAVLEENAALIDITAKWQKLVQDLADSITSSIFTGDFGGDPSELECFHAREVGRIAGQWSLAYYIQNLERINRNAYYRSAVIGLREHAMRDAASNRRRYLTRCRTTLPVVPFDYELKPTVSWIPLTLQFPDFSSDLA
ncbi:hypothetical protein B0H14DRAFT_2972966 [Mycena olivaceomarginata]|nr:hypothetical protein B0H14DRAFT_2972966 [Mycena olivaceomarginata]